MSRTQIVIPCFNEARRLRAEEFVAYARAHPDVSFLMVNDGSTDGTLHELEKAADQQPDQIDLLDLPRNVGKADAVRQGMLQALSGDAEFVGYFDADLATPLSEIGRFVSVLDEHADCDVVLGARVQLLGRRIQRSPVRHYLGRVFATVASRTLGLAVYDTQCGAKLFRSGPRVHGLFAEPFVSNWIFDVELLARWIVGNSRSGSGHGATEAIRELPLLEWVDVEGSKVSILDFARALRDMIRIRSRYLRGIERHGAA